MGLLVCTFNGRCGGLEEEAAQWRRVTLWVIGNELLLLLPHLQVDEYEDVGSGCLAFIIMAAAAPFGRRNSGTGGVEQDKMRQE